MRPGQLNRDGSSGWEADTRPPPTGPRSSAVKHGGHADPRTEMLGIDRNREQRLGRRATDDGVSACIKWNALSQGKLSSPVVRISPEWGEFARQS
jgi:hypothetical protein